MKTYDDIKQTMLQSYVDNYDEYETNQQVIDWITDFVPDFVVRVDNSAMEHDYDTRDVVDKGVIVVLNETRLQGKMFDYDKNTNQYYML